MSTRARETSTPDQGRALLETAGKTVLLVRFVALLLRWSRLVPVVRRHPGLLALAANVVVTVATVAGGRALALRRARRRAASHPPVR